MMRPRIVCVGANLESEVSLKCLIRNGVNITGLVTLPTSFSETVSDYRDLHGLAYEAGIPVIETNDINSHQTLDELRNFNPDYLFVLGWSQILKSQALSVVSGFVVGSHPTPLPQRRGRAPIPWTILDGADSSAVTLFKMSSKVDDGPILVQKRFDIPERPKAMDVYQLAAKALSNAFIDLHEQIVAGEVVETTQYCEEASYRGKRTPQDGFIDFCLPAKDVDCLIRAASAPYPGAYFFYKGNKVVVWDCDIYDGPERVGRSGQILAKQDSALVVRAADNCLLLRSFEIEGKSLPLSYFDLGDVFNYRVEDELHELKQRVAKLEAMLAYREGETR
ncbi:methionyl-tRNA formyltransferase [Chromohalobacter nigrandesensis]|uniref:methionyl-tRNA formyltransferase n=1 Tax=Chromohalobacter nigrandesensis TaxID=119863 RepID=UPI001FF6DB94|nr:formyltransferase family protein [Chromohalobacter nigrandesensis]MCK0743675.1 hypothetical protein [Chromohalobacter nigrandesensis]